MSKTKMSDDARMLAWLVMLTLMIAFGCIIGGPKVGLYTILVSFTTDFVNEALEVADDIS